MFFHPQESLENSKYHGYTVRGTPNCLLIVLRRFQHTPGTYPKRPWATCLDFIHIWGMFQDPVGIFLIFLFLVGISTPNTQCTLSNINMGPTNHSYRKEHDLPDLHDLMIFWGWAILRNFPQGGFVRKKRRSWKKWTKNMIRNGGLMVIYYGTNWKNHLKQIPC